ncbi:putative ankyrin repeat protein RF_0381 [Phymastichus coffea]|uniref:putative ankyrin repeat protein RF_0381 n=1 Tax=Phymastichus coffea TaxID=108790 RepID=UPI00273BDB2A|nr:putative ankyrin repeat protein RF_0381 [Phymastichus coffea]
MELFPGSVENILMMAVKLNEIEIVRETINNNDRLPLVENGTLLWVAVSKCNSEIAKILVQAGADVNVKTVSRGLSLLHFLAVKEYPDIDLAVFLMDNGAEINAVNNHNTTVLDWAIYFGKTAMVEELLNRGARVTNITLTAITNCHKPTELIPLIINDPDVETRDNRAIAIFLFLMLQPIIKYEILRMMINLGIPLNRKTESGHSLLQIAVKMRDFDLITFLLDHGADVNLRTDKSFYPLIIAISLRDIVITKVLIKYGANIHENCTNHGSRPIHFACSNLSDEIITLLLKLGVDISVTTNKGWTSLSLMSCEDNYLNQSVLVVIKHIALLMCQGITVSELDLQIICDKPIAHIAFENCMDELVFMQHYIIYGNITQFCIISYSVEQLSMLVRNNDFIRNYSQNQELRRIQFPFYNRDMEIRFRIAEMRNNIISSKEKFVDQIFHNILPLVILKIIAYYLCLDKIQNLERNFYLS